MMKRRTGIKIFLIMCMSFLLWHGVLGVRAEDTPAKTVQEENLQMLGGQIRTIEPMGLRMIASIQKSYLQELQMQGDVEYGILLLPKKYLTGNQQLTIDGRYLYNGKIYKPLVVPAKKNFHEDKDNIYFTAVLANVAEEKYKENYEARPYVKVITSTVQEEGEMEFSEEVAYGEESIDRQIYQIAEEAVNGDIETPDTKQWLQDNILDPVDEPEGPSEEDKAITFQLGKVSTVTLYKKNAEEDKVEEAAQFDKEEFDPEEHLVKVEFADQPEIFSGIKEIIEKDNTMYFKLDRDDYVTRTGNSMEKGAIVEFGKISDGQVTTKYVTMQSLLEKIKKNPGGNFKLSIDLDASQIPGADALISSFSGTLDGQGHKITGLNSTLFGEIRGGTVKNLILENAQVTKNGGSPGAGLLANNVKENSAIENVHVSGTLKVTGRTRVGGIAGYFYGATMERCSANIDITSNRDCVGGLVGEHDNWGGINAYIKDSYAVGKVWGDAKYVGGLIGWHKKLSIENCYAAVEMKSNHASNRVGGFTGWIQENGEEKPIQHNVSLSTGGKGYKFDGMSAKNMLGTGYQNNYTLLESDLTADSTRFGELANGKITEKSREELLKESFYTEELGWDADVWDFTPLKEGKTPVLKGIDTNSTVMPGAKEQTEEAIPKEADILEDAELGEVLFDDTVLEVEISEEEEAAEPEATPEETEAAVAARYEEAQEELELADLSELDGYREERRILYENLKVLMPFYNEEQIIKDGNQMDASHVLNKEPVLTAYPLDAQGRRVIGLTTETAPEVKQIRIQFVNAKATPLVYSVRYIDTRSDIASYEVSQLPLHYNFNKFVVNTQSDQFRMLLEKANGYDFEADIKTRVSQQDVEAVIHSYRRNYLEVVKTEMEQILVSFVANNPQYPVYVEGDIAQTMTQNLLIDEAYLQDFLYAYNYADRWYDFEIGGINIRDVVIFDNSLLKTTKNTRSIVTEITKNTSNSDRQGNATAYLYSNRIAPYMGINSVGEFLEYFMSAYAGYEDVDNWIVDNFKGGVVVEARANNPKITTRMWHFIKRNTVQKSQQLILPLLSYKTSKNLYIASFPTALIYGNLQIYWNYEDSDAGREAKRRELSSQVSMYRNIYDNFVDLAQNGAASVNNSKFLIVDSSYQKNLRQDVFIEFYKQLGTIWGSDNGAVAVIHGNPDWDYIYYNSTSFIGDLTVLNHEMGHVTDAWIWMENKGKRPWRNGEDYSNGFANQANLDYNMNFMRDYSRDSEMVCNLTPERINSQEEFKSYYKEVFETIYTLDYLQGLAYLELSPDQQAQITAQHHYGFKDAHQTANSTNSTWNVPSTAQLESMNLQTLDDLWDNQLTIRPGQRYDIKSQVEVGANNFGAYQLDRLSFSSWYVPYVNGSTPNAQTFRRNGFELGGLFGYSDGLVEYLSGRTQTGDLAFYKKMMQDENFSFEKYRKDKNKEIEEKIKAQKEQGNPYFDEEALIEYFKQNLINYGNGIHTGSSNFGNTLQHIKTSRENVFRYLQRITNEFRSPVYADNAEARQAVEISTAEELVAKINENPNGFYVLTKDISMESVEPQNGVYIDKTFIGKLEGRGYKIANAKAPLLRRISNSYVSDLTIENQEGGTVSLAQSESYTIRVNEIEQTKEIATLDELKEIGKNKYDKYVLTADIDASEFTGDVLIGGSFSSLLEGNNYTITGLRAPLFEKIDKGTVQNLKITDVDVKKDGEYAVAIAKRTNHAVIQNISLENVKLSGTNYVAPITGYDYTGSVFSRIQVRDADITASGYYSSTFVGRGYASKVSDISVIDGTVDVEQTENGGFIGSGNHITVERVYSDADITLTGYKDPDRLLSAGFIGRIYGESRISNVFTTGDVICEDEGKVFYKFTASKDVLNTLVQEAYELESANGHSNAVEGVDPGRLTIAVEADRQNPDFYRLRMNLDEEIWNLTQVDIKGYPELKGMEKGSEPQPEPEPQPEADLEPEPQPEPNPEEEFPEVQNYPLLQDYVPAGYEGIYSAEDLKKIDANPYGRYILMNNISMEDAQIEKGTYLNTLEKGGVLDGNNQVIYGLKDRALFERIGGNVTNLRIQNVAIDKGTEQANVLAHELAGGALIQRVHFSHIRLTGGSHTAVIAGKSAGGVNLVWIDNMQITIPQRENFVAEKVGGAIGHLESTSTHIASITNTYVEGTMNMDGAAYGGGVAGTIQSYASVTTSISNVRVKSSVQSHTNAGFVGQMNGVIIESSFTMSDTSGEAEGTDGYKFSAQELPLAGQIIKCYELVAENTGLSSVTDVTTANEALMSTTNNHNPEFFSSAETLQFNTFAWDMSTVAEKGHPTLKWFR